MFIDASALAAIVANEPDSLSIVARIEADDVRLTSPTVVWETSVAVSRILSIEPNAARKLVFEYMRGAKIELVALPEETAILALDAFDRYGKGRHKAKLNFGDCFSYACAKHFRQPLMFKGDDFALTDIDAA